MYADNQITAAVDSTDSTDPAPPHSPAVVDVYVAAQRYTAVKASRKPEDRGRALSWYALAVSSDGREVVSGDGFKALAMAGAVGELIKAGKGQTTYRILPHDRIHHRLGTSCSCDMCMLLDASPEYGDIVIAPGSAETLDTWEEIQDRCTQKVIEAGIANTVTSCRGVTVPCTEVRDSSGVIISRTLPRRMRESVDIATDASQSTARNAGGIASAAAVASDGRYIFDRVDTRKAGIPPIDYAELAAIYMALRNWVGSARCLNIRTDSRKALGMIRRARSGEDVGSTGRALGLVTRVVALIDDYESLGGQVTVEWVRGHSGDPLNEGADRIALHARRAAEWGTFDDPAIAQQCCEFAEEAVANYRRSLTTESVLEEQNLGRVEVPAA